MFWTFVVWELSSWWRQRFWKKSVFFLLFMYSRSYEPTRENYTTMEQVVGHILLGCNSCWSFIFFLILCEQSTILFLLFNCKSSSNTIYFTFFSCLKKTSPFLIHFLQDKCIVINWRMATTLVVIRSIVDIMSFLNILIQVISP